MASPYRSKFHPPAMPSASRKNNSSSNVSKNISLKENSAADATRSEGRAPSRQPFNVGKATTLPKATKKSFMSPTFSASSKAKRILSERNDHTSLENTLWDRMHSRDMASVDAVMIEDDINKDVVSVEAMEVDSVIETSPEPPSLEESQRKVQRTSEPPTLEELHRKVRQFLEENTPQRKRESTGSDAPPKDSTSPPYHPIHSPFSVRPDFVHVDGSSAGLLESNVDLVMSEAEKQSSLPPYDPKKNYLSPRPQFLRYRPNRCLDLVPTHGMEMDDKEHKGFVENYSIRSGDFTAAEFEVGDEIRSLERQIASVELDTEKKHGGRRADELCEDEKGYKGEGIAAETMSGSCISSEPAIVEETLCRPSICTFEPMFNIKEEVGESKDEDGVETPSLVHFLRNFLMVLFAVFTASVVILASGSSGLLPSSLHDNPLANLWQSSRFYTPTMEALRGAEGFWGQGIVPPEYGHVRLEALQQHSYSDLRMKLSGFWTSLKEIATLGFENLKYGGNFLSSPKIVAQPSFPKDSVFSMDSGEENLSDIVEEEDKASSLVPPFEYGGGKENPWELSEVQIHGEFDNRLQVPISRPETSEFESHPEMQSSNDFLEYGDESENSLELLASSYEEHVHGEIDSVDRTVSSSESVDFEGRPGMHSSSSESTGFESHPGMHSSCDFTSSPPEDSAYGGAEGSETDNSAYGEDTTYGGAEGSETDNSAYEEDTTYGGADVAESVPVKSPDTIEVSADALDARVPEISTPELLVPMGGCDACNLDGFSQTVHLVSHPRVQSPSEFGYPPETEIYSEPESSDTSTLQNFEDMGTSSDEEAASTPFSMGDLETVDTEILGENGFPVSTDAVLSQQQENREEESELSGVHDSKPSEILSRMIPGKSVRSLFLIGSMGASVLAAALAATYLAYRSWKGPTNATSADAAETSSPEAPTETNYPRRDGYLTPARTGMLFPQRHYSYSMQMNMNTPDENLMKWRGSSVPTVELLHEYSPATTMSNSENRSNPWVASVTGQNASHTPERRVRRKSSSSSATLTPEMSMDISSYGSFTTYDKVANEEQVKVTPVRRSSRIRNQTNSPNSGRAKPLK